MQKHSKKQEIIRYIKKALYQKIKTDKQALIIITIFSLILVMSYITPESKFVSKQQAQSSLKDQFLDCTLRRVIDGDTIIVYCPSTNLQSMNIRIWGLDAPEMGQKPWGEYSQQTLIKIFQTNNRDIINVKIIDIDQYNRYVGQIFINNKAIDVGLELIKQGFAVVYKQYNHNPQYHAWEDHARVSKLGIWQTKGSQQDPSAWRKVNPL
ncbi:thermonuclease family protein [Ignatzschineria sp. LJL83]